MHDTILSLVETQSRRDSTLPALLGVVGQSLSYGALAEQIRTTVLSLNGAGIGPGDRVAVVLPNGPEMAACCLSVASTCVCAPLHSAYRAHEFDFYLNDLHASALIVMRGMESAARQIAERRRIPVFDLVSDAALSGQFDLETGARRAPQAVWAGGADVALVLPTSGTTSRPKMVPLTHSNLTCSAQNIQSALKLTPADCCLNMMPLFHIHGLVGAVLSSISAGASVLCAPGFEAPRVMTWLDELQPTWYTAVPTMHQAILARAATHGWAVGRGRLRLIRSSSAALPPQLMEQLEGVFGVPVIESYGMTEASHQVASNPLPPRTRKRGSVGVPAGPEVGVMDADGNFVPPGVTAEVAIRGPNVTERYENDPEANRAFHAGWFRTGDQGYLDADGYLFLTGRLKEVINRAGEKISPHEVDEVLLDHAAVAQAVTFALPDEWLGEDVGAAVVLEAGATASEIELKEFVASRLADFKVPRRLVLLDEIPKSPTGKLQRIGLADTLGLTEQESPAKGPKPSTQAPESAPERMLCQLWEEVLGIEGIGVRDDFFRLGGDSVLAVRFLARLQERTGAELSLVRFFDAPTVAAVAATLEPDIQAKGVVETSRAEEEILARLAALSPAQRARLKSRWLGLQPTGASENQIPRRAPGRSLPLTSAQQRLWFLEQIHPGMPAYHVVRVTRIHGTLDPRALRRSLQSVVSRHESLRTTFVAVNGSPTQVVSSQHEIPLPVVDLSELGDTAREAELERVLAEETCRAFSLDRGLMLRATLVRLHADEHALALVTHHIASDGWSMGILSRDLCELYRAYTTGGEPHLPALAVQYGDFALWQQDRLQGDHLGAQLSYWHDQLKGIPSVHSLPTDRSRPEVDRHRGSIAPAWVSPGLYRALKALGSEERATPFMVLIAAFQVLLRRYSGSNDIAIGSPFAGRTRREIEELIGFFANTLVMRADLSGDPSFRELLGRVRQKAVGAFAHNEAPFERLVEDLDPPRSLSHSPLVQVMFVLQNHNMSELALPGVRCTPIPFHNGGAKFDLTLQLQDQDGGLGGFLEYSSDLFNDATARRMVGHYQRLLEGTVADPNRPVSRIPMLPAEEHRQLVDVWNRTEMPLPAEATIHHLIERQVHHAPDATAVAFEDARLTYRDLNRRANRLARHLRERGVKRDDLVGVYLHRSLEMLVAPLAVFKAGAAYVPLDPDHPPDRLGLILEDARPRVVITHQRLSDRPLPYEGDLVDLDREAASIAGRDGADLRGRAGPDDLAYVIHTSGSTGTPKGVEATHHNVVNQLAFFRRELQLGERDTLLAITTLSFDPSVVELFLPLVCGARTAVVTSEVSTDGRRLAALIGELQPTVMQATPATWQLLLEAGWEGDERLRVLCGGEAMPRPLADALLERCSALWNVYGPTETTIWSTASRVESGEGRVSIGRPIGNARIYILDHDQQPVPIGVPGELFIAGAGVARGYLNRPELTPTRFLPDPFGSPGDRMYRTGDLGRFGPAGDIEFLGREDNQVKLRGYRIELGEIESWLARYPGVKRAIVTIREDAPGDRRLVAYLVSDPGGAPAGADLRDFLEKKLPRYMVPAAFVALDVLPLTPTGKVNRRALPAPELVDVTRKATYVEPRTSMQRTIAETWAEALGLEHVGVHDNFFDLGGHSLLSIKVVAALERKTGIAIGPLELMRQNLGQLASHLEDHQPESAAPSGAALAGGPPREERRTPPLAMQPFLFGPADTRLFGAYHPAAPGFTRDNGVLICPPMGHEYYRTHRALLQLAELLSQAGYPIMRFDYYGCGDSAGETEDATLRQWLRDIAVAREELQRRSGKEEACLVGLRLGGSLALKLGAELSNLQSLVLWDPIVRGTTYLDHLRDVEQQRWASLFGRAEKAYRQERDASLLGFPYSAQFLEELARLDLTTVQACPAHRMLLIESGDASDETALSPRLPALGRSFDHYRVAHIDYGSDEIISAPQVAQMAVSWVSGA